MKTECQSASSPLVDACMQCQKFREIALRTRELLSHNIPVCLEVLLVCSCFGAHEDAIKDRVVDAADCDDQNSMLLEQWTFESSAVNKRTPTGSGSSLRGPWPSPASADDRLQQATSTASAGVTAAAASSNGLVDGSAEDDDESDVKEVPLSGSLLASVNGSESISGCSSTSFGQLSLLLRAIETVLASGTPLPAAFDVHEDFQVLYRISAPGQYAPSSSAAPHGWQVFPAHQRLPAVTLPSGSGLDVPPIPVGGGVVLKVSVVQNTFRPIPAQVALLKPESRRTSKSLDSVYGGGGGGGNSVGDGAIAASTTGAIPIPRNGDRSLPGTLERQKVSNGAGLAALRQTKTPSRQGPFPSPPCPTCTTDSSDPVAASMLSSDLINRQLSFRLSNATHGLGKGGSAMEKLTAAKNEVDPTSPASPTDNGLRPDRSALSLDISRSQLSASTKSGCSLAIPLNDGNSVVTKRRSEDPANHLSPDNNETRALGGPADPFRKVLLSPKVLFDSSGADLDEFRLDSSCWHRMHSYPNGVIENHPSARKLNFDTNVIEKPFSGERLSRLDSWKRLVQDNRRSSGETTQSQQTTPSSNSDLVSFSLDDGDDQCDPSSQTESSQVAADSKCPILPAASKLAKSSSEMNLPCHAMPPSQLNELHVDSRGRPVPSRLERQQYTAGRSPMQSSPAPLKRNSVSSTSFGFDPTLVNVKHIRSALEGNLVDSCVSRPKNQTKLEGQSAGGLKTAGPRRNLTERHGREFPDPTERDETAELSKSAPEPSSADDLERARKSFSGLVVQTLSRTNSLLGNFEESLLNGRILPVGSLDGFRVDIGASSETFCPKHVSLPVCVFYYRLSENNTPCPYFGHVNLDLLKKRRYSVPVRGSVQVTLFNPQGTVVKVFVLQYDLSDMPRDSQTFRRQRTIYMPVGGQPAHGHTQPADLLDSPAISQFQTKQLPSYLRYLIHLRFASNKTGRCYLHTDIRLIFALDHFGYDSRLATYELRSFTEGPVNPKYSPRK